MQTPTRAPRICKLPPELIDQIAAGEVVERAASVVKELCENSLDAGARRIDVEVAQGGSTSIRIVDDGCGMTPEEARLALERHATSKISSESDLWGVETFGFRGEALPSIASVSRLTLQTRTPEANEGFCLQVQGGRQMDAGPCGIPQGTQIEIQDLFFNTPARLKFQKTEATETSNIAEAVLRLAIANPDVHFRMRSNGRVALDLPPHRDLAERVRAALAKRSAGVLHEAVGHEHGVSVHAFLAGPECVSTTSRNTFIFVGRRFVRDRSLLQAITMGYGDWLEKGRYPLAVLFVDVAGEDLDVNVHPQKMEVRFAHPQPVCAAVRHVLQRALTTAPWLSKPAAAPYSLPPGTRTKSAAAADAGAQNTGRATSSSRADFAYPARPRPTSPATDFDHVFQQRSPLPSPSAPNKAATASLRYIGTLAGAYLLLEDPGVGLLLVDWQAAQTRLQLRQLSKEYAFGAVVAERLLFPIPIEIDEAAMTSFLASSDELGRLGFEAERFGPRTVLVRAVPRLISRADPKPALLDVLATLAEPPSVGKDRAASAVALIASHHGSRADVLDEEALADFLAHLDFDDKDTSGRPIHFRLTLNELASRFGRE